MAFTFTHGYQFAEEYSAPVAYFCMEYAIHQPLKLYAGGLGYLAGSHLRSAYELRQNMVGVGILWKYGYYDQTRKSDQSMDVLFQEKVYGFLVKTNIRFSILISGRDVWVTVFYLPPEIFNTAPLFLLSTDLPENDYAARTITHRLYDSNPETSLAAGMLLGIGGCKLFDYLTWQPQTYHLNESHGLPLAFFLLRRFGTVSDVRKKLVFTIHTPEDGGNLKTDIHLLDKLGFFSASSIDEISAITATKDNILNHTYAAMCFSRITNAVSARHLETLKLLWAKSKIPCLLISITNAQNYKYWASEELYNAVATKDDKAFTNTKRRYKEELFELVADQNGEIFDKNICTIVFAKRFAGYKRPDLLLHNIDRFEKIVNNQEQPVQIIWAGKPYPMDYAAIGTFDRIVNVCKSHTNCAALVGYELKMSKILKRGTDIWLNLPRLTREASGTSGMTAAMNGAVNLSILDGWYPEFARNKENGFVIPSSDISLPDHVQDDQDSEQLYDLLENEIIPLYYNSPETWLNMQKAAMADILPKFDSSRMAIEYYERMYKA